VGDQAIAQFVDSLPHGPGRRPIKMGTVTFDQLSDAVTSYLDLVEASLRTWCADDRRLGRPGARPGGLR
jgi:hypothetical protein